MYPTTSVEGGKFNQANQVRSFSDSQPAAPPTRRTLFMALGEQQEHLEHLQIELNELEARINPVLDVVPIATATGAKEPTGQPGPLDIVNGHNARLMGVIQRLRELTNRVHL